MNKRITFIIIAVMILIGAILGGKYYLDLATYRREIATIEIGEIDLGVVPDGTYTGSFDTVWIGAQVEVKVQDKRMIGIELQHRHDRGAEAEVIPERVLVAQSLDVDLVSGASNSSMVILKAIENALVNTD